MRLAPAQPPAVGAGTMDINAALHTVIAHGYGEVSGTVGADAAQPVLLLRVEPKPSESTREFVGRLRQVLQDGDQYKVVVVKNRVTGAFITRQCSAQGVTRGS